MLDAAIKKLVQYGINSNLIPEADRFYSTNMILDLYHKNDYTDIDISGEEPDLETILTDLTDEACRLGFVDNNLTSRDLFDAKLMNCIMPRPSQVIDTFWQEYEAAPVYATEYYYKFSRNSNYIRMSRVSKDIKWKTSSVYGELDITINLSKPEKDPKAIAAAKTLPSSSYPKCLLCMENEGYAGNLNHPARNNHRIIPLSLCGSRWGFQYSPYVYYNEHCIVFNSCHTPMKIDRSTFEKLFDFVKIFPHYFLGSNADLPIVGGSILSHDHFQGGNYTFAMAKASSCKTFRVPGYESVTCHILKWPLSVIRLTGQNTSSIVDLAEHILNSWKTYTDADAFIFSETEGEPHNTITPIARFQNGLFELDLVLRNNITTVEHPLGVFHPHEQLHHIKKENIGLIEVMGLAVLPARLKDELDLLEEYILSGKDIRSHSLLEKHADWVDSFLPRYNDITSENIQNILREEVGKVFIQVLEDAGVYKCTPDGLNAFMRFIRQL